MTEYQPEPDLRANAFVGAWERIEAAQKLKIDANGRAVEQLPELYWATIAEAAVLADLTRASRQTGEDSGRYIYDHKRRVQEARDRFRTALLGEQP